MVEGVVRVLHARDYLAVALVLKDVQYSLQAPVTG